MIESLANYAIAVADLSRLQSVEEAYRGSPFAQNNRLAKYTGISDKGYPVIRADGNSYNVLSTSNKVPAPNQRIVLRSGKNIVRISY